MDRFKNNKSLRNNMIKKLSIFFLLFLSLIFSGYSANHTITSCSTFIDGDTYIIDNFFIGNTCTVNANNVVITSNGVDIKKKITFTFTGYNNTLDNILAPDLSIGISTIYYNTTIKNSNIYNMSAGLTYVIGSPFTQGTSYYQGYNIINNTFKGQGNTNFIYTSRGGGGVAVWNSIFTNLDMENNDIIGFQYLIAGIDSGTYISLRGDVTFLNNAFILSKGLGSISTLTSLNSNNNFLGWLNTVDSNLDYVDDTITTILYSGFTFYNGYHPIKKTLRDGKVVYTYFANSPNYYSNNEYIYVPSSKTFDGLTTGIDLTNVQGTTIDLSLLPNQNALILNNIKTLKMGTNNKLDGGIRTKPKVVTGSAISTSYSTPYAQNNHLIEYINSLEIDNIWFQINHQYPSFIRKQSFQDRGEGLVLDNNKFELNVIPTNNQPLFEIGCNAKITNNEFDSFNQPNVTLFNGGSCLISGTTLARGGHLIQGNTFTNGGIVLYGLIDTNPYTPSPSYSTSYNSIKFNYNSLTRIGTGNYASLLDPNHVGNVKWNAKKLINANGTTTPIVNDNYYYKTTCQNYLFNLGNYYQEITDYNGTFRNALGLVDNNNDGIYDNGFSVGQDFTGKYIYDNRPLTTYPYDFTGNIAQSQNVTNTCGVLSYDIIKPVDGQTYSSSTSFDTAWKYSSTTYSNLYCRENFNGVISDYSGVNSQDLKGLIYGVTDGTGTFQVTCADTPYYDNLVIKSPLVNFQIGSLTTPSIIDPNPIVNPNPNTTIVYGCTDNTATNYNPLATVDDGSCVGGSGGGGGNVSTTTPYTSIDVIDYNSVDNTNQNTIGFMQDIMSFITNVGIPAGILVVVIVSVLAVLRLLI